MGFIKNTVRVLGIAGLVAGLLSGASLAESASAAIRHLKAEFSGRTLVTWDAQHGTQIEYLAGNGSTYLWRAGDKKIVSGQVRFDTMSLTSALQPRDAQKPTPVICYRYGGTWNPVTGKVSKSWECVRPETKRRHILDSASGDIFNLAGRDKPPVTLDKKKYDIKALLAKIH